MALSRRSFLLASGAAAVLAACGGDDDGGDDTTSSTATDSTETSDASGSEVLGVVFDPNSMLVAGIPQRAPFVLYSADGGIAPEQPDVLTIQVVDAEGNEVGDPTDVARRGDDVDRPYFPLITTFAAPGQYAAVDTSGRAARAVPFMVRDAASSSVPQVGAALPRLATPTVAAPGGVQTICTQTPACALHDVSVEEALVAGRPVAVLASTPEFCQIAICGPVLDLLVGAAATHPDVALVHLEVYPNGQPPDGLSPLISSLGIGWEPVLFVAGADGNVTARLDNIYDGQELAEALATAT